MRILFTVHDFPPEFTGGVERATEALALELASRGHEVHVLAGSTARRAPGEDAVLARTVHGDDRARVVVHRWRAAAERFDEIDTHDPVCGAYFEELLGQLEPDVVHVHHWARLTSDLVAIAARAGVAVVGTLHDHWASCGRYFRLPDGRTFCERRQEPGACAPCLGALWPTEAGELEHAVRMRIGTMEQEIALAQAWTVSGARHRDELVRHLGLAPEVAARIRVLPMGLGDGREPAPGRFTPRRPDERVVIAHWGNLAAIKGVEQLVAAAQTARQAARIELVLLGGAVDEALLERVRAIEGPARVVVGGSYRPDELPALLARADAAAFFSLARETHSLVVDEALDLGLPLLVSDRGAMADRVGARGIVVPAGDGAALSAALDRLVDDDARRALAGALPPRRPSLEEWADGIEALHAGAAAIVRRVLPRDFTRDRLAFRNGRLGEIARYLGEVERRRLAVRNALSGSAADLRTLQDDDPELAARIATLLGTDQGDPS